MAVPIAPVITEVITFEDVKSNYEKVFPVMSPKLKPVTGTKPSLLVMSVNCIAVH